MEIGFRPSSPSRRDSSRPKRPNDNREGDWRRGTSCQRRRKRSRSKSCDRDVVQRSTDPSVGERVPQGAWSGSQTLTSSLGSSPPASHPQVTKGKGKAVDLGRTANDLRPSTSESQAGRATIDNRAGDAQARELPNAEHTVIDDSKRGNRDRAPKALTLRQSVRAHLSLQQTEPLRVSRLPADSGPGLRHGHPSLLERISGMEEFPHKQLATVSAVHPNVTAGSDPAPSLQSAAAQPDRPRAASNNIGPADEGAVDIDNHSSDPISNPIHQNSPTARTERHGRAPGLNIKVVSERTRTIRLAEAKDVMEAGTLPITPMPPPMAADPPPLEEPGRAASVVTTLRNRLLERLESERKRANGAASGESEVDPLAGSVSEGSLKAELRARNELRARLAVAKADRHVGNLEP